jgi:hypothetical protein
MRLVSGLLTALLIGLAFGLVATWSDRRFLLLAVAVAATPMVFVFGSAVNPSGLEMASALCAWTGLLILVLDRAEHPPPSLVAASTAASGVLVLCRALSPLWLLIIAISVAALRPSAIRSLAEDQRVRRGSVIVGVATLAALVYDGLAKPFDVLPVGTVVPNHASMVTRVDVALGNTTNWIHEFIGAFGWGLTSPPLVAVALLGFALCALWFGGLVTSEPRQLVVFLGLTGLALVLPVALVTSQMSKYGVVWQARDGYPLYCGVIVVAGAITRLPTSQTALGPTSMPERMMRRIVVVVAACVALAQFADLVWAFRRYVVGMWGPLNIWATVRVKFTPPVPLTLLFIAALVVCATYGWWIVRICGRMSCSMALFDFDSSTTKKFESKPASPQPGQ